MNTALLLVDIQNDYFPDGRMCLEGSVAAAARAKALLSKFRDGSLPVVHIQHISTKNGAAFFLPGTAGAEIHPSVQPLPDEKVIVKHSPNSFRQTDLMSHLLSLQVSRLVICGMMTHMCIDATVRAAFDHGFSCTVIADACAAKSLAYGETEVAASQVHAAFLAALASVYAHVTDAESFLRNAAQ